MRALIVGHGLAGAQLGHMLLDDGWEVRWFADPGRPGASPLSIGLLVESWITPFVPTVRDVLASLDERYGFLGAELRGRRVPQLEGSRVLEATPAEFIIPARVRTVGPGQVRYVKQGEAETEATAHLVIVAAGAWSAELVRCRVAPRWGAAFRFQEAPGPVLKMWAPFRHLVLAQHADGYWWGGDGGSYKANDPARWAAARTRLELAGARGYLGHTAAPCPTAVGAKLGIFQRLERGLMVATGGNKSTTVLAAHWALRLRQQLRRERGRFIA